MLDFLKNKLKTNKVENWENQQKIIRKRCKSITEFLNNIFDVPYMIIGGRLVSYLTGYDSGSSDIDIFFYNETDFEKAHKIVQTHLGCRVLSSTENAITFSLTIHNIHEIFQIIRTEFGPPQDIFDKIDINCSKIVCTNGLNVYKDESFSLNMEVDERNLTISTFTRMCKYIADKHVNYVSNDSFLKAFEYNSTQLESEAVDMYGISFNPCNSIFLALTTLPIEQSQEIHKEICKTTLPIDLMFEKFSEMTTIGLSTLNFFSENLELNHDLLFVLFFKDATTFDKSTEGKTALPSAIGLTDKRQVIYNYIHKELFSTYSSIYPEYFI
jgi:hypothetical protein